ncbi:MAG: hypothetical protein IJW32_00635 [Clostridia bacterium]|nr:hypothetical protein [Clostridia bacterium]
MKQTEITVQVFESIESVDKKLKQAGFSFYKNVVLSDFYFIRFGKEKTKGMQYKELIENSILLRNLTGDVNETELIFKNKHFDKSGNVIEEEKLKTNVDNFEDTLKILKCAKLYNWCKLTQKLFIYKQDEKELCVQDVDGLGIFIEYEEEPFMREMSIDEKLNKMINNLKELNLKLGEDFFCKKVYMKYLNKK